ncbi:MAG: PhzF family phenazine biosynthesis protein [Bacteroidota bacterium]
MSHLYRYVAFSADPAGGNPAGVWIGRALPPDAEMQRIAAEVGYSETAFVAPEAGPGRTVRYFSPKVEVPFCGHATIATGAALGAASGAGTYRLSTAAGSVPVTVRSAGAHWEASLTSVEPAFNLASARLVSEVLSVLHWNADDLDDSIPPALAYAGAWHLVLAAATRERLDALAYDFDALATLMRREGFVTAQLVWRERAGLFHSRNPFPVGGVVEDPATGAAAAALGGYLREAGLMPAPFELTIRQGEAMGRPSVLAVNVPAAGGITVTGAAVPL